MDSSILTLSVNAASGCYPIIIGQGVNWEEHLLPYIQDRQVFIVTNTTVAPLYESHLCQALSKALSVKAVRLSDGEIHKNSASYLKIIDELMQSGYNRDCVVIALGGGVVGDMAGFAAATYQRGVHFIQIPTTLLAQVDSSVGGKTGINHPLGKNMIGAFKQPQLVLIDTQTLSTLPDKELSAGLSEVIKYAAIADIEFMDWLEAHLDQIRQLEPKLVAQMVYRCCQHKAKIVDQDEFEAGKRALLNFGHTFGHAIENHEGYGKWLHGEAVGAGMVQAADLSCQMGWITKQDVERLSTLIKRAGLPVTSPIVDPAVALKLMGRDKKVKNGQIRLVLLKSLGDAVLTSEAPMPMLLECLKRTAKRAEVG